MSQLIEKIVKISDDALSVVASTDARILFGDNHEQVQKSIQKIAWRSKKISDQLTTMLLFLSMGQAKLVNLS
jgi:hypothetical protein